MSYRRIHDIDPKHLKSTQGHLLRKMLELDLKNNNTHVWFPSPEDSPESYEITYTDNQIEEVVLKKYMLIHAPHINVATGKEEDRYFVYLPEDPSRGTYGLVYNILGVLDPDPIDGLEFKLGVPEPGDEEDDSLIFKRKSVPRVVKVESYIDDIVNKEIKQNTINANAKQNQPVQPWSAESKLNPGAMAQNTKKPRVLQRKDVLAESELTAIASHLHARTILDERHHKAYILMRKFPYQLNNFLNNKAASPSFDIEKRLELSLQILSAVNEQVHKKQIFHRDLKPENIMLDDDLNVYIIDFGFGKKSNVDDKKSPGTTGYAAPEVETKGIHTFKSDNFSLGKVMEFVWSKQLRESCTREVTAIQSLINKMTADDPDERPSLEGAISEVNGILFSYRLAKAPYEFKGNMFLAYKKGLAAHEVILSNPPSFDKLGDELKSALNGISDDHYSIGEFVYTLGLKTFKGLTSKKEILAKIGEVQQDYTKMIARIETLSVRAEVILTSLLRWKNQEDSRVQQYIAEINDNIATLQVFKHKLVKHQTNFDKLHSVLLRAVSEINDVERSLSANWSLKSDAGADEAVSNETLATRLTLDHTTQSDLVDYKNAIRTSIQNYISNRHYSIIKQSPNEQQRRNEDIIQILDIVDYADNQKQLEELLANKLKSIVTGRRGRSNLRDAVQEIIDNKQRKSPRLTR